MPWAATSSFSPLTDCAGFGLEKLSQTLDFTSFSLLGCGVQLARVPRWSVGASGQRAFPKRTPDKSSRRTHISWDLLPRVLTEFRWFNLSLEHLYRPNSPSGSGLWQYKQHWTRVHTEFLGDNPQKVPFHTESNSELKKSHIMYYVPVINSPESDRRRVNIQRSSLLFMWQRD